MVALAFQLEDERLLGQVRAFLDWTLDHQGDDGWCFEGAVVKLTLSVASDHRPTHRLGSKGQMGRGW